jgi:hypothetical protein
MRLAFAIGSFLICAMIAYTAFERVVDESGAVLSIAYVSEDWIAEGKETVEVLIYKNVTQYHVHYMRPAHESGTRVQMRTLFHGLPSSPHTKMAAFYNSPDFVSYYEKLEVVDTKKKISASKVLSPATRLSHRSCGAVIETHTGTAKAQSRSLIDMGH